MTSIGLSSSSRWLGALAAAGVLAALILGASLISRTAGAAEVAVGVGDGAGGNVFVPSSINIAVGDTVNWNWASGFHNVVAVDGSFNSGAPHGTPGAPFSQTFSSAGSFFYYCAVHSSAADATDAGVAAGNMVGKVVVAQGSGGGTATARSTTAAGTATATTTMSPSGGGAATPAAPRTGQAGLAGTSSDAAAALLLLGLAGVSVLGARALTSRVR